MNISSGLPYAMSRAGFFTGLFLLFVLCYITDWTIRLIVTNAKLSGTTSYIGIMNRCFGPSGRAAISFFQFSFAFGGTYVVTITCTTFSPATGMCAFGIIIGKYVAYEYPLPCLFPRRRYDPACHPLRLPQPPIRTCPLTLCQSTIHNRALHCRCFLSIVTIP